MIIILQDSSTTRVLLTEVLVVNFEFVMFSIILSQKFSSKRRWPKRFQVMK